MSEIDDLRRQIQKLMDQQAIDQRKLRYELGVMNMRDAWQFPFEDNVDATHPLQFAIYIPPTTKETKQVLLRLQLKAFRAYSTGAASGGGSTPTSSSGGGDTVTSSAGGETTETSGVVNGGMSSYTLATNTTTESAGHTHDVSDLYINSSHTHNVTIPNHTHDVTISSHTHDVTIPNHTHGITYGIYTSTSATGVTVTINGTDRTAALGGGAGFTTDQDELDITQYLTATGWNTVSLASTQLGRIHATTFVNLYLPQ